MPVIGEGPHSAPDWKTRFWQILIAIFIFEVGLVLIILPWRDMWYLNYFRQSFSFLEYVWDRSYFRGAISVLGAINLYIALAELRRAFRKY